MFFLVLPACNQKNPVPLYRETCNADMSNAS
jgi:hypothetical protein